MGKNSRKSFYGQIPIGIIAWQIIFTGLCVSSPLLLIDAAWAQKPKEVETVFQGNQDEVSFWIKQLKDTNLQNRKRAMETLVNIGSPAIPSLTQELTEPDEKFRRRVAQIILQITVQFNQQARTQATDAVNQLGKILGKDPDEEVRILVADILGNMGVAGKDAIPALIESLKNDPSSQVSSSAANALGNMGIVAKDAVPALSEVLANSKENEEVAISAANALGHMGKVGTDALPTLIDSLKNDSSMEVRSSVAIAVSKMGAEAQEAVPEILNLLKDPESEDGCASQRCCTSPD
jgi:HEAT repeat protein